jgi:hypothetical protein
MIIKMHEFVITYGCFFFKSYVYYLLIFFIQITCSSKFSLQKIWEVVSWVILIFSVAEITSPGGI